MPTTPHDGLCLSSSSSLSLTTTPLLLDSLHITLYNTNHVRAIQPLCRLCGLPRSTQAGEYVCRLRTLPWSQPDAPIVRLSPRSHDTYVTNSPRTTACVNRRIRGFAVCRCTLVDTHSRCGGGGRARSVHLSGSVGIIHVRFPIC